MHDFLFFFCFCFIESSRAEYAYVAAEQKKEKKKKTQKKKNAEKIIRLMKTYQNIFPTFISSKNKKKTGWPSSAEAVRESEMNEENGQ